MFCRVGPRLSAGVATGVRVEPGSLQLGGRGAELTVTLPSPLPCGDCSIALALSVTNSGMYGTRE